MTAHRFEPAPAITFSHDNKITSSSPYPITWPEIEARYCFNAHRRRLADRFCEWVLAVHDLVAPAFIWIGGSFVTDKAEPADIDTVLFYYYRQAQTDSQDRISFLSKHASLLSPAGIRARFGLDAGTVALSMPPQRLVEISASWTMIFSGNADGTRRGFYSVPAVSVISTQA
jgi:hypothetical protein